MQKIAINEIPSLDYEGYIWYSDRNKPKIIDGDFTTSLLTEMPFVIEGNLYAKTDKVSIQIKNIDGKYFITKVDLSAIKTPPTVYIGHDLDGRNFKMVEYWETVEDEYLEGMKTLKPAWTAFAGFTELKTKKS